MSLPGCASDASAYADMRIPPTYIHIKYGRFNDYRRFQKPMVEYCHGFFYRSETGNRTQRRAGDGAGGTGLREDDGDHASHPAADPVRRTPGGHPRHHLHEGRGPRDGEPLPEALPRGADEAAAGGCLRSRSRASSGLFVRRGCTPSGQPARCRRTGQLRHLPLDLFLHPPHPLSLFV